MKKFFILLAVSLLGGVGGTRFPGVSSQPSPDRNSSQYKSTHIIFTGDILLDRGVRRIIDRQGIDALFTAGVDSLLQSAQVVVGNLECPATRILQPVQKRFVFRAEPEWLFTLRKHGFTHLNLCNNHSIDQGREGLMDTKRQVKRAEMVAIGAGQNMNEASQPVLLATLPRRVWMVSSLRLALENFAYLEDKPCVSQEPMEQLLNRVSTLRRKDPSSVIIVSLHWGGEHTLNPVPEQRLLAHRLIRAGADALICHHTHTLQTIENYQGHPIYYSIGNFIFDQSNPLNANAAVVKLTVTKEKMDMETIPITIVNCRPRLR